jgi:hypothetical protein
MPLTVAPARATVSRPFAFRDAPASTSTAAAARRPTRNAISDRSELIFAGGKSRFVLRGGSYIPNLNFMPSTR